MKRKFCSTKNGFVVLVSVLVAGAAAAAITVSLLLSGSIFLKSGISLDRSVKAKSLVNACAEEALMQIRDNAEYEGTGNLNLNGGTCNYTVVKGAEENRSLNVEGSVDEVIRRIKIQINAIYPKINVTYWQEVADF